MRALFPYSRNIADDEKLEFVAAWAEQLANSPWWAVEYALKAWIRSETQFPTVADIRKQAEQQERYAAIGFRRAFGEDPAQPEAPEPKSRRIAGDVAAKIAMDVVCDIKAKAEARRAEYVKENPPPTLKPPPQEAVEKARAANLIIRELRASGIARKPA